MEVLVHVTEPPRGAASLGGALHDAASAAHEPPDSDSPLRLFIDHAPAAVAMFDRQMRYVAASRRWRDHYGLPPRVEGLSHYDLLPDIPAAWREVHRRALAGVPQASDGDVWERADGTTQYLKWQVLPWQTRSHEVGGVLITVEDVTERARFEQALERAERYSRSILESISDGFVAVDRAWRFTYVNRVAAGILGTEPDDLLGRVVCVAFPGVVGSVFEPVMRRAMDHGQPGRQVAYYADHGRWYEAAVYPYADGISVLLRDVTDQRLAEQRLQQSEARQQLAMRAGRLAAWEYDAATGRNTWDGRMAELLAVPPERAAEFQQSWREFVHPHDRPRVDARFDATLRDEGAFETEYRAIRLDGEERWFASRADEVRDETGRLVRLVGIVQDVTLRRAAEAHAARVLRGPSQGRVPRDARARAAQPARADPHGRPSLSRAGVRARAVQRARASDQAPGLAHGAAARRPAGREPHHARQARAAPRAAVTLLPARSNARWRSCRGRDRGAQHRLQCRRASRPDRRGRDPTACAGLSNLLTNAAKYTPGRPICAAARREGDRSGAVTVADDGIGMTADALAHRVRDVLAAAGRRGSGPRRARHRAALVRRLVRAARRHDRAHSAGRGRGSEFVVRLPLSRGASRPAVTDRASWPAARCRPRACSSSTTTRRGRQPRDAARLDGHAVPSRTAVPRPRLRCASSRAADVVVLDIGMPGSTATRSRAAAPAPWGRVRLIAVTGWGQDEDKPARGRRLRPHLTKPVDSWPPARRA
jgi:PAS domain S-box-containing protein